MNIPSKNGAVRYAMLWTPVALWAGFIFVLSAIPDLGTGLGWGDLVMRKAAHAVEFAVLAGLLWRALEGTVVWSVSRLFWVSVLACVVYAISDEYHQWFVPGRVASVRDVLLDTLGSLSVSVPQRRWRRNIFSHWRASRTGRSP